MVEINLISWRAEKRAYEEKVTRQIIAASAAGAMLVMICAHLVLKAAVKHHEKQLQHVTAEIPQSYVSVGAMSVSPAAELAVLLDAANFIGGGVCYQRITKDDSGWMIEGRALSAQAMLSGLRTFEKIPASAGAALRELKKDPARDEYQFVFQMRTAENQQGE